VTPRRKFWVIGLGALAVGVAVWLIWFRQPPAPTPPAIDLSRADPEVAAAVAKALDAVSATPRDAAAWGKLGMVLRAHDFDTDSVAALRVAEQLDPADYRWPYLQGLTLVLFEPEAGLDCLRRAAERAPSNRPEPRLRHAEALLELGRLDDAEAQVHDLTDPRAQVVRVRAAAERQDWMAVVNLSDPVRAELSCRKRIATLRGDAFQRLGLADASLEWKLVAELPDDEPWPDPFVQEVERLRVGPSAKLRTVAALLDQSRGHEAILMLKDVVGQHPKAAEPRLLLGEVLNRAGAYADARETLLELTKQFPESVEGWFQLGVAEFQLGNTTAATKAFERVVELKPDHARGYFNLGHSRKKTNDRAGAVLAFEAALKCRPDYEAARDALKSVKTD
jgi:cytochrome c-type biogenesis protein CcmH/NrfG